LADQNTLLVVVDTNRPDYIETPEVLGLVGRVVVIDHHRRAADYIEDSALNLHEPYASSACELITEVLQYIVAPSDILRAEAECVMAGITLDTKNFTMKTGVRTFEAAAFLRRCGADTIEVKRLFQNDLESYFSRCDIIRTAIKYRDCIAIAHSAENVERPVAAQAADELLGIAGIQASFVIYRNRDTTHVSGRSLGQINVQVVLERLGGGGSLTNAGAQMGDRPIAEVADALKHAIDAYYSMS
jgi:c-di-AMP phosphodiesterase-like protein